MRVDGPPRRGGGRPSVGASGHAAGPARPIRERSPSAVPSRSLSSCPRSAGDAVGARRDGGADELRRHEGRARIQGDRGAGLQHLLRECPPRAPPGFERLPGQGGQDLGSLHRVTVPLVEVHQARRLGRDSWAPAARVPSTGPGKRRGRRAARLPGRLRERFRRNRIAPSTDARGPIRTGLGCGTDGCPARRRKRDRRSGNPGRSRSRGPSGGVARMGMFS